MVLDFVFGIGQVGSVASGYGRVVGQVTQRPQLLQRVYRDGSPGGRSGFCGVLPYKMVETRLERIGLSASFGLKIQCLSRILRRIIQLGARRVDVEMPRADQSSQRAPAKGVLGVKVSA